MKILLIASLVAMLSCNDDDHATINSNAQPSIGRLSLDITTDKALYAPGETVNFSVAGEIPANAMARVRCGLDKVMEQSLSTNSFTWATPATDGVGYLVDIYTSDGTEETIYGTTAVDVSSDWKLYPRYGFVATYDASKTPSVIAEEMAFLNRCHINGIQFYDWHYEHHRPLPVNNGLVLDSWQDIANRDIRLDVVKEYIARQHAYGMKSMFYNLCYGALDNAAQDGVEEQWHLFSNSSHTNQDKLTMPSGWKSDIYIMDPANTNWQQYLTERNQEVYGHLEFDGFHIDQVGDRGTVYDYYGSSANLSKGFASFINVMKEANPDKRLVMNAVSSFGVSDIASTGNTDFLYNEVWDNEKNFSDLRDIIRYNTLCSNGTRQTVLAAYMNYNQQGAYFNEPGVLLMDAVTFALGGAHLELGDHMLCHEYFANNSLKMSESLKAAIIRYYDFLTAYQHLLRGKDAAEVTVPVEAKDNSVTINAWPPQLGGITTYCKNIGSRTVVHLLNFKDANSLSWRDMDSSQPEPSMLSSIPLQVKAPRAKKVWVATPDQMGGAPQELSFEKNGDYITLTLPSLKYWTMIVIE